MRCIVAGCENEIRSNDRCGMHYMRFRRTGGDGLVDPFIRWGAPIERFLSYVQITETCWPWSGAIDGYGYGTIWWNGKPSRAYRVSYEIFVAPILPKMTIDHLCRVRGCVNPDHLEMVTLRENIQRAIPFRPTQSHCYLGHPFHTNAMGRHVCTTCKNASNRRAYHRRKASL